MPATMLYAERFVLDDVAEVFDVYTDGSLWNGWHCPRFTREQADRVCEALNAKYGDGDKRMYYDPASDAYRVREGFLDYDDDGMEPAKGAVGVIPGAGSVKLYSIGGWSWCWWKDEQPDSTSSPSP